MSVVVVRGALLVPVGGVLVAHYYLRPEGLTIDDAFVAALYDTQGPLRGVLLPGMVAWIAGAVAYFASRSAGGTIPALVVSVAVYRALYTPNP